MDEFLNNIVQEVQLKVQHLNWFAIALTEVDLLTITFIRIYTSI